MTRRQQACFVAYAGVLLAGFLVPLQACQELPAEKQEEITKNNIDYAKNLETEKQTIVPDKSMNHQKIKPQLTK